MAAIITLRKESDIYPIAFFITLLPVILFFMMYYFGSIDKITITYRPWRPHSNDTEKEKEKIEVMSNYYFFGFILISTFVLILLIYWRGILGLRPKPPGFDKKRK